MLWNHMKTFHVMTFHVMIFHSLSCYYSNPIMRNGIMKFHIMTWHVMKWLVAKSYYNFSWYKFILRHMISPWKRQTIPGITERRNWDKKTSNSNPILIQSQWTYDWNWIQSAFAKITDLCHELLVSYKDLDGRRHFMIIIGSSNYTMDCLTLGIG